LKSIGQQIKILRALTTYLGWTDARHFHIPRSALRGRGTKTIALQKAVNLEEAI
jgi:hypothetical protein